MLSRGSSIATITRRMSGDYPRHAPRASRRLPLPPADAARTSRARRPRLAFPPRRWPRFWRGKRRGAAAQDEPQVGGTLREGYDLDFSQLDPVATNWYDPAFHALYDSLLIDAPDGTLQPNLAESWEVSDDGKTVTFVLKEGGLFHSGRPLDRGGGEGGLRGHSGPGQRFAAVDTLLRRWSRSRRSTSGRSSSPCPTRITRCSMW